MNESGRTLARLAAHAGFVLVAAFVLTTPFRAAAAARPADDAKAVVQEAQRRTESKSERYEGLLKTVDAGGKTTEKRWTYVRLGSHGQSKAVIRFLDPPEVKGVALLIVNHPDRASDQWMWTPAIERDRRIALQDRSTRFFGTDFTFEDLEERDVEQYDYALLPDETIAGAACWKIQSTPREARRSQYTKSVIWIRKDNYAYVRADLFVKDEVVRRLTYGDLRQTQAIWTSYDVTMADLRRGSRTELISAKVQYNLPLQDEEFTLEAIRR
jgi:hypothetical protein